MDLAYCILNWPKICVPLLCGMVRLTQTGRDAIFPYSIAKNNNGKDNIPFQIPFSKVVCMCPIIQWRYWSEMRGTDCWRVTALDLHSLSSLLSFFYIISLPSFSLSRIYNTLNAFLLFHSSTFPRYSLLFLDYCTCLVVQQSLHYQTTISPTFPNIV